MRAQLIAVIGCILLAAPAAQAAKPTKGAKTTKVAKAAKTAKVAKKSPLAAFEALDAVELPADGEKRIAFAPPSTKVGVSKKAPGQAIKAAESLLKEEGFSVVAPPEVKSALVKRKIKAPACKDDTRCFARLAKAVDAGLAANLVIEKANKQFLLKLMVYESAEGKAVATAVSMVPALTEAMIGEAMKKQVPRAVAAIHRHLDKVAAKKAKDSAVATAAPAPAAVPQPDAAATSPIAALTPAQPAPAAVAAALPAPAPAAVPAVAKAEAPAAPIVPVVSTQPASPEELAAGAANQPGELDVQPRSKTLPMVLAGVGTVSLAVGGVFGAMALRDFYDFKTNIRDRFSPRGAEVLRSLRNTTIVSTAGTVTGALCFAASAGVLFMPERKASKGRSYTVAPTGNGVAVAGSF